MRVSRHALISLIAACGCKDHPAEPAQVTDPLAGRYETVVWQTFRVNDSPIDLFLAGGSIWVALDGHNGLSGAVHVPDSAGTDWDGSTYSFAGTYSLEGSTLNVEATPYIWGGIKQFSWAPKDKSLSWRAAGRTSSNLVLQQR